jgi:outer membrane receptor protein involved in Fe transport
MQSTGIYTNKSGFGVADFLLGDIASTIYNTPPDVHQFLPGHSFFGQATWRVAKNFTVNYGLRYELYAPMLNRTNSVSNFSPANGGSLVPASASAGGWSDRALINADKNNVAPRFGFSNQSSERVVFSRRIWHLLSVHQSHRFRVPARAKSAFSEGGADFAD